MKKLNKTQLKKLDQLQKHADSIQPDVVRGRDLTGATENDGIFYDKMNKRYKQLCKDNADFVLTFVLPESKKHITFFRNGQLPDQEKYSYTWFKLSCAMYDFIYWNGHIEELERQEFLKILPKGKRRTFKEETGI